MTKLPLSYVFSSSLQMYSCTQVFTGLLKQKLDIFKVSYSCCFQSYLLLSQKAGAGRSDTPLAGVTVLNLRLPFVVFALWLILRV